VTRAHPLSEHLLKLEGNRLTTGCSGRSAARPAAEPAALGHFTPHPFMKTPRTTLTCIATLIVALSVTGCDRATEADRPASPGKPGTVQSRGNTPGAAASPSISPMTGGIIETPVFYRAAGEYALPEEMALAIASEQGQLAYTLKTGPTEGRTIGGGMNSAKVGEAFLMYWDSGTQTLWWATTQAIGYKHLGVPNSTHSATFLDPARVDRQIPKVFLAEVDRTLRNNP